MKCVLLSLAGVAPEDFGIPSVKDGYYDYLPPKWAFDFHKTGENFVLFLDEITQATIQVLHAIYPVVLDKRIGGLSLPNMRVIAASNYDHENPNLTTIMQPLLNRFAVEINIEEDFAQSIISDFWVYIKNRYPAQEKLSELLFKNIITTNPRAYESGYKFLNENPLADAVTKALVCRKAFGDMAPVVMNLYDQEIVVSETHDQERLKGAAFAFRNNITVSQGVMNMKPSREDIIDLFKLSKEEAEIVFI